MSARAPAARRTGPGVRECCPIVPPRVGYQTDTAFSRAFRRKYGSPPAAWRRNQATRGRSTDAADAVASRMTAGRLVRLAQTVELRRVEVVLAARRAVLHRDRQVLARGLRLA